jgi:hypothetical protein
LKKLLCGSTAYARLNLQFRGVLVLTELPPRYENTRFALMKTFRLRKSVCRCCMLNRGAKLFLNLNRCFSVCSAQISLERQTRKENRPLQTKYLSLRQTPVRTMLATLLLSTKCTLRCLALSINGADRLCVKQTNVVMHISDMCLLNFNT